MDDSQVGQGLLAKHSCFNVLDSEPQRKKRCIRFSSDISNEDPLLISDSGFGGELTGNCNQENGDEEVSSFFQVDTNTASTELFEDANHSLCGTSERTTSIDTLSLHTDLSDLPDPEVDPEEDPTSSVDNSLFATASTSSSSDPGCGSLSSSVSSEGSSDSHNLSEKTWTEIFTSKEIQGHPGRIALMQRFLSHLRNNPDDSQLQRFMNILLSCPEFAPPRHKLRHVTSMHDATRLLRCSKKILVLTGAGISVSCGIPDFRSKDGLYSRVSKVFPQLRDPQSVFDIRLFRRDPRPFFLTAKELYPGQFEPSLSHKFIRKLEARNQLLRNYSQNIDTLETIAGIDRVTMCHGSFATATCIRCKFTVKSEDIKDKVLSGDIPFCPNCSTTEETSVLQFPLVPEVIQNPSGEQPSQRLSFDDDDDDYYASDESVPIPPVLKPDIVFFGEDLPDEFHNNLNIDKPECDLLLVIGSSLRVRPVSLIPGMLPPEVPQILINRESLPHCTFDIELLGNCDTIISQLCRSLGSDFMDLASTKELNEVDKLPREPYPTNNSVETKDPQSEHDIQALKACWEPKINENIAARLPEGAYLNWRPRQYIFEGAEVDCDPDEDDDDDGDMSSSSSESDSETSSSYDNRESGTENEVVSDSPFIEPTFPSPSPHHSHSPTATTTTTTDTDSKKGVLETATASNVSATKASTVISNPNNLHAKDD